MTKTVIPSDKSQERRMNNPGKNNVFVGSRSGGKIEEAMTKKASIKHQNPEYFKRQSDSKKRDESAQLGRGIGQIGTIDTKNRDNIPARKDVPIQRDLNKHQKNVGSDPGRGEGKIGRDSAPPVKSFSKGTMY